MFPAEEAIDEVKAALERNRPVVLTAPPGSGKTTCIPPALLDAEFLKGRKILMLEPRRVAARNCAAYISRKLGTPLGGLVGYQVRLEKAVGKSTRLEIVTEGLLTERLLSDPELTDTGLVIFDEFHERSLQCDLAFAMALDARRALRDDLRILVMSATLDAQPIAAHLGGDAQIIRAEGRMFPVETRFLKERSDAPCPSVMAGAVKRALAGSDGDILCFLPGEGEIRRTMDILRDDGVAGPDVAVMPLYGALSREEQDDVFLPNRKRKVILSTSIAETSVTIEGVSVVIDSGLMRVGRFSSASGMGRLETLPLTRDRADQRRGRAGRTQSGVCYRLWTEDEDRLLKPTMNPEILEADLASCVLAASSWGTTEPDGLPWLTPPPVHTWNQAKELLKMLGALDNDGRRLTDLGREMASMGAHPRLAAMMLANPGHESAMLAAIMAERLPGPFRRETDIRRITDWVEAGQDAYSRRARELARRWERRGERSAAKAHFREAGEILAYAFPDRIAKNRGNATFTMVSGRGAWMERTEALASSEYLVMCELNDQGSSAGFVERADAKALLAAPISEEAIMDIFSRSMREETQTRWDTKGECVKATRSLMLGRMTMREGAQSSPDADEVQRALFQGIKKKGAALLPWSAKARQLQSRILFLRSTLPEEEWPDVSDAAIEADPGPFLGSFTLGMSRWSHLERLDMCQVMDAALGAAGKDRRELDSLAPERMPVPSGSVMTIHYDDAEPYVAVRLQETFGMESTPAIARGRVPIVMHLLSPAQRPVQITKDLAGFWRTTYQLVRKDLRGRYPKHYWPEDPLVAVATRRVKNRMGE